MRGPIAYTFDGDIYCADHGAEMDTPENADNIGVIYEWDEPLDILQSCGSGGHDLCGNCGHAGPFFRQYLVSSDGERVIHREWLCSNCRAIVRVISDGRTFQRWGCGDAHWHYVEGT